ncbi:unnamed protein product [Protopolystoma xenopodis]|uniref:Uncharacterized protein n=1 Tax=Protopolystoma xenopodis TaxID=117903 RepID=A0A3S5AN63_9PLAT|nr:unnamed protein product [Protopolystoma xenopodis]
MHRSVQLLLTTLSEQGDWRRLLHIFHQLRRQPPEEKRGFLSEADRVFLARRAFNLIQPALTRWLFNVAKNSISARYPITVTTSPVAIAGDVGGSEESKLNTVSTLIDHSIARVTPNSPDLSPSSPLITLDVLVQLYRLHCLTRSRTMHPPHGTSGSTASIKATHTRPTVQTPQMATEASTASKLILSTSNLVPACNTVSTKNQSISSGSSSSEHLSLERQASKTQSHSSDVTSDVIASVEEVEKTGYAAILHLAYQLCPAAWVSDPLGA